MSTVLIALLAGAVPAYGQLPTEPVSLAEGRVVFGAEATATFASDDPGFFNYTNYEYSALRNLRVGVGVQVHATRRLQLLAEVRTDNGDALQPFALYARIRPWPDRRVDIQVGRIPPTFGAYGRGTYGTANMLIGMPLGYQYLTSLRSDALPADADDLLQMRGRGWLTSFPVGNRASGPGLPLVNTTRWDTGVQLHAVHGIVEWTGAVTTGSLSNPRVDDDNSGRQVAARVVVRPVPALAIGGSAARGAFLDRHLDDDLRGGRTSDDGVQQAFAVDAEYSMGHFLARAEIMRSTWTLPISLTGHDDERLHAVAVFAEGRYRLLPGMHVALRAEHLGFSSLPTANGLVRWDAPVKRVEIGGGYALIRNVVLKGSWQINSRDAGRIRRDHLGAVQVLYWF